jgi:hypothetical protein
MSGPDWGVNEAPKHFRTLRGADDLVTSDDVDDVPAVVAARAEGWFPAHEAPLWCFIPAIWPVTARTWTPDVRIRHKTRGVIAGEQVRLPWNAYDYFDVEADTNCLLADIGLPARPGGRIWLLRPPPGHDTLESVLHQLWSSWRDGGGEDCVTTALVAHAQLELDWLFS